MSNVLRVSNANPVRLVITSWKNRNANDRDYKLFKDFSKPHFDSYFQPFLNTDTLVVQWDSSFNSSNKVKLKNYYTDSVEIDQPGTIVQSQSTYTTYKHDFDIDSLSGKFYIEITGSDSDTESYTIISEPIEIKPSFCNTVLFEAKNFDNAFGLNFSGGYIHYMRVPALFNSVADETETEIFTDSAGNRSLINAIITRARKLKTYGLVPQWVIEKINLFLAHDVCKINDIEVAADQAMSYDVVSNYALWAESEVTIKLASGSSNYQNINDDATQQPVLGTVYETDFVGSTGWTLDSGLQIADNKLKLDGILLVSTSFVEATYEIELEAGTYTLGGLSGVITGGSTANALFLDLLDSSDLVISTFPGYAAWDPAEDATSKTSSVVTVPFTQTCKIRVRFLANANSLTEAELSRVELIRLS